MWISVVIFDNRFLFVLLQREVRRKKYRTFQISPNEILDLGPINVTVPSFKGACWNWWENGPLYAEYEAKWREACRH